jgi:phage-related protein
MFTEKDESTDNPVLDRCNYRTSGCRCRENELHFGGFPASSMV